MASNSEDTNIQELIDERLIRYWDAMEFRRVVDQRVLDQIARRVCQRFFLLILRGSTLEESIEELATAAGHRDPKGEARRLRQEFDGHRYEPLEPSVQSTEEETDTTTKTNGAG